MLTLEELAAISLLTDYTLVEGEDSGYIYMILEKFEGRPVYTHEIPRLAEKHRDKIAEMVREIYDRARAQAKFEKTLADEAERTAIIWNNLFIDPPTPAEGGLCERCKSVIKDNDSHKA